MERISQGQDFFLLGLSVPPPLATIVPPKNAEASWVRRTSAARQAEPSLTLQAEVRNGLLLAGTSYFPKSDHAFQGMSVRGTSQLPAPSFTRGRHVGILLTLWQSEHRTKEEHLREKFLEIVQALQER